MLNGIIVINKPAGMTSADVVYKLRKILHIKKIGHAGTLDPDVSGVLPVAVGQATKLIERLHEKPKQYQGIGRFGQKTDTGDISGQVIETKELDKAISSDKIVSGMKNLTGDVMQVPPMYSAVKINGRKLYEYARAGETIEVPPRQIHVFNYELVGDPNFDSEEKTEEFGFKIKCSKGTYVRTLIEQLGDEFDLPAVMVHLQRIESAGYTIDQAISLEDVEKLIDTPEKFMQPIESVFQDMVKYKLTDSEYQRVQNGAKIKLDIEDNLVALWYQDKIKAIYQKESANSYRAQLMLLGND